MDKINHYLRQIENTIARQDFDLEPAELYEPMAYILGLGGKRLRPALCLAACEMVGGALEDAMLPSLGIEVFHNFTLLHDDIMDEASLRRGKPTVHKKWNNNIAILSGDAMLVKSYQYISTVKPEVLSPVLQVFSQTALEVCEGQQYDLNYESSQEVSEDDYLEMIRLKTSVLLGGAMKIGALIGGASHETANHLYEFGVNIGVAFQIQDDLLDAFGDPEKFGKIPGGDILNDKKTILYLHTLNEADEAQRELLTKQYSSDDDKVQQIRQLMQDTGARSYAEEKMDAYYRAALDHLQKVEGEAGIKLELAQFAEWLIKREK